MGNECLLVVSVFCVFDLCDCLVHKLPCQQTRAPKQILNRIMSYDKYRTFEANMQISLSLEKHP